MNSRFLITLLFLLTSVTLAANSPKDDDVIDGADGDETRSTIGATDYLTALSAPDTPIILTSGDLTSFFATLNGATGRGNSPMPSASHPHVHLSSPSRLRSSSSCMPTPVDGRETSELSVFANRQERFGSNTENYENRSRQASGEPAVAVNLTPNRQTIDNSPAPMSDENDACPFPDLQYAYRDWLQRHMVNTELYADEYHTRTARAAETDCLKDHRYDLSRLDKLRDFDGTVARSEMEEWFDSFEEICLQARWKQIYWFTILCSKLDGDLVSRLLVVVDYTGWNYQQVREYILCEHGSRTLVVEVLNDIGRQQGPMLGLQIANRLERWYRRLARVVRQAAIPNATSPLGTHDWYSYAMKWADISLADALYERFSTNCQSWNSLMEFLRTRADNGQLAVSTLRYQPVAAIASSSSTVHRSSASSSTTPSRGAARRANKRKRKVEDFTKSDGIANASCQSKKTKTEDDSRNQTELNLSSSTPAMMAAITFAVKKVIRNENPSLSSSSSRNSNSRGRGGWSTSNRRGMRRGRGGFSDRSGFQNRSGGFGQQEGRRTNRYCYRCGDPNHILPQCEANADRPWCHPCQTDLHMFETCPRLNPNLVTAIHDNSPSYPPNKLTVQVDLPEFGKTILKATKRLVGWA